MGKPQPGSFIISKVGEGFFRELLIPDHVIRKLSRGSLIAEFRLDQTIEDIWHTYSSGKNDEELPREEIEAYLKGINDCIVNRQILNQDESEVIWVCWDSEEDRHYLIPESAIKESTKAPDLGPKLQGLPSETDLGEADYLFLDNRWHYVKGRQPYYEG